MIYTAFITTSKLPNRIIGVHSFRLDSLMDDLMIITTNSGRVLYVQSQWPRLFHNHSSACRIACYVHPRPIPLRARLLVVYVCSSLCTQECVSCIDTYCRQYQMGWAALGKQSLGNGESSRILVSRAKLCSTANHNMSLSILRNEQLKNIQLSTNLEPIRPNQWIMTKEILI